MKQEFQLIEFWKLFSFPQTLAGSADFYF